MKLTVLAIAAAVTALNWQTPQNTGSLLQQLRTKAEHRSNLVEQSMGLAVESPRSGAQCIQCKGTGWNPRTRFKCVPCGGDGEVGN